MLKHSVPLAQAAATKFYLCNKFFFKFLLVVNGPSKVTVAKLVNRNVFVKCLQNNNKNKNKNKNKNNKNNNF